MKEKYLHWIEIAPNCISSQPCVIATDNIYLCCSVQERASRVSPHISPQHKRTKYDKSVNKYGLSSHT